MRWEIWVREKVEKTVGVWVWSDFSFTSVVLLRVRAEINHQQDAADKGRATSE